MTKVQGNPANQVFKPQWSAQFSWDETRNPELADAEELAKACFDWVKSQPNAVSEIFNLDTLVHDRKHGNIVVLSPQIAQHYNEIRH
jgi:hypothetical protein